EELGYIGFNLRNDSLGLQLGYRFGGFLRDSLYEGIKQDLNVRLNRKGWHLQGNGSLLQAQSGQEQNEFFRPKLRLEKTVEKLDNWVLG
ncbi:MAG: hypothetical protein KDC44_24045, partial [Phaeodactylibacter sp.]|nr:hypothetical protein [Phaeodactylibacter sp.]